MDRILWRVGAMMVLLAAVAPAGSKPRATPTAVVTASCVVCAHEGDSYCVEVKVTAQTPRSVHGKRTYYFCSHLCRRMFLKSPEKYLEVKKP